MADPLLGGGTILLTGVGCGEDLADGVADEMVLNGPENVRSSIIFMS